MCEEAQPPGQARLARATLWSNDRVALRHRQTHTKRLGHRSVHFLPRVLQNDEIDRGIVIQGPLGSKMDLFNQDLSALELYYPDAYEELQEELQRSQSRTGSRSRRRTNTNSASRRRNNSTTGARQPPRRFYVGLLIRRQNDIVLDTIEMDDRYNRADMVSKRYLTKYFRGNDDDGPWMELIEPEPTSLMTAVWDVQQQLLTVFQATAQLVAPTEFIGVPHGRLIHKIVLKRTYITSMQAYRQYRYAEALKSLYE